MVYAQECSYELLQPKVAWKAFKTYEKVGVKGAFDKIELISKQNSTIEASLIGSTVDISVQSLNSGNKGRDETLLKSFFGAQNVSSIKAVIKGVKGNKLLVDITMNKITKTIPMQYTFANDVISGKGVVDLSDFDMLPSLKSINKACFDLHEGKTWQDVELEFELKTAKKCK